jgi:hypothetical protein
LDLELRIREEVVEATYDAIGFLEEGVDTFEVVSAIHDNFGASSL